MAEWIMERISYEMNLDPLEVRLRNVGTEYKSDVTEIVETLKKSADYDKRKTLVEKFNSENRWKKRGLRFTLLRWVAIGAPFYGVTISVYHEDGTVAISHGGIEMGQGINTKAIQICAYFLNISVDKIQVKPADTFTSPNNIATGSSVTSKSIGTGVQRCCEKLLKRLEPVRAQLDNPTWENLIQTAFNQNIDLQTHYNVVPTDIPNYNIYGLTLSEVEIDVLTGEWNIKRVDLIEDAGRSVNPDIDIGQVEGAFIMGVGYCTTEDLIYDQNTGELLTNRTWEYWVPQVKDIPGDFRVTFRRNSYSSDVILGAKAIGEPATCMGVGVNFAMRAAIVDARSESGLLSTEWFDIDGPYTVEKICLSCATKKEDFRFN